MDLNYCIECTAILNKGIYSYFFNIDEVIVIHKSYLYKNGIVITNVERIELIDIKFKRVLKRKDEYICKSIKNYIK